MKKCLALLYLTLISQTLFAQSFDLTQANTSSATGTSNGIAFTYSGPNWMPGTTTDNSFTGFSDSEHYLFPLTTSDRMHIWNSGTYTFETALQGVYIYTVQNPGAPGLDVIDFEVDVQYISGDLQISGSTVGPQNFDGGIYYVPMNGSNTLSFTSPTTDGYCSDVALLAVPLNGPDTVNEYICSTELNIITNLNNQILALQNSNSDLNSNLENLNQDKLELESNLNNINQDKLELENSLQEQKNRFRSKLRSLNKKLKRKNRLINKLRNS